MGKTISKRLTVSVSALVAAAAMVSACGSKPASGGGPGGEAVNKDIHILLSHSNAKYAM